MMCWARGLALQAAPGVLLAPRSASFSMPASRGHRVTGGADQLHPSNPSNCVEAGSCGSEDKGPSAGPGTTPPPHASPTDIRG